MQRNRRMRIPAIAALVMVIAAVLPFRSAPAAAVSGTETPWGASYFPNVPLVTQDGRRVRFFDDLIKGKVVSINFIYTSCTDACPLETAQLRKVQEILGDRVGRDVFMYSITIDPKTDTPAVLKRYAKRFEVGPGWLFLTGKKSDITLLRRKLGLYSEEPGGDNLASHTMSLIIGNQSTGQWMKSSAYENPYVLATQIGSWLSNWKAPSREKRSYADAPKVRNISKGESLFRTRCASCHTIAAGGAVTPGKRPVGPDLWGVTWKRDRAWLTRWLAEPDKMLAEKDALAVALLAEYRNVSMPNLRLSDAEVQALLAYMEDESRRGEPHDHSAQHDHGH